MFGSQDEIWTVFDLYFTHSPPADQVLQVLNVTVCCVMLNSTVPLYGPAEGERKLLVCVIEHFNEVSLARGADGPERVGTSF